MVSCRKNISDPTYQLICLTSDLTPAKLSGIFWKYPRVIALKSSPTPLAMQHPASSCSILTRTKPETGRQQPGSRSRYADSLLSFEYTQKAAGCARHIVRERCSRVFSSLQR